MRMIDVFAEQSLTQKEFCLCLGGEKGAANCGNIFLRDCQADFDVVGKHTQGLFLHG